jgi:hypothetical protein
MACYCRDIGVVGGFSGAMLGTSMMFVFPPIMFIASILRNKSTGMMTDNQTDLDRNIPQRMKFKWFDALKRFYFEEKDSKLKVMVSFNMFLLLSGLFLAFMGTINNIINVINK